MDTTKRLIQTDSKERIIQLLLFFNRTNHGISLTEEGSIIYDKGKKIIRKSDKLLDEIRKKKNGS